MVGDDDAHSCEFPPISTSIPRARDWFRMLVKGRLAPDVSDVGGLLLTELTTNAVVHARTMFVVTTAFRSAGLRVRVDDRSFQPPRLLVPPAYPSEVVGGWGLQLVDQLATRWGHDPRPDGKSVWFELDPVDLANRLA